MTRALSRRPALLALLVFGTLAGTCPQNTASLPASDSTPPSPVLDVFSLPPQATATPSNPETVTSTCCVKQFKVLPGTKLSLSAAGSDPQGIRSITINVEVTRVCSDPRSDVGQSRRASGFVARNVSSVSPSPGVQVPVKLNAAGNLALADRDPGCLPTAPQKVSLSGEVWASAVNFFGMTVETKHVKLGT